MRMISASIEAKTWSKFLVNLVSRSRMRNRTRRPASSTSAAKLRAAWVTQGAFGLAVTPRRWTYASLDFDHEQRVIAAEEDRVDGEEVGGHDALGLGTEELGPPGTSSPGRWRKAMTSQDIGDTALRDDDAELFQLPDDAQVPPAGILPGESEDQLDRLLR